MTIGSLFAGIGGFDIAARWLGWRTAWYSEIDPYACAVMRKHFPLAINHGDITAIDGRTIERVDILCGGFPCQDISTAGKGVGIGGSRSGLWKHYARLIEEIRPRYVVAENVSVLRSRGLDVVLQDLDALGYAVEGNCIPASFVGAPHQRDRIWLVAYPISGNVEAGCERQGRVCTQSTSSGSPSDAPCCGETSPMADANNTRLEGWVSESVRERASQQPTRTRDSSTPSPKQRAWWDVEPNVGRVVNGVPSRVDRLRCLGNAIVPKVAYEIFRAIERREMQRPNVLGVR